MSRKQDEYLEALLSKDGEAPAPSPALDDHQRHRMSPLLGRESALARIAAGDVRQVTQQSIDPSRCRIWSGNARVYAGLNEESCRDLIDSIIAEGGQKVPAVVRRMEGDPDHDFEVVAGTRRHWSISWLRAHSYPDFKFLVQIHVLDDEAAFRIADLENRARKDVSDLERARNYAWALGKHYGGVQARMAERLRVSKGWLSKMLKVAELPDEVISAFAAVTDVQLKPAYELALAMDKPPAAAAVLGEATKLVAEQELRRKAQQPPISSSEVMTRLMRAPIERPKSAAPVVESTRQGRPIVTVMSTNRQGVTLKLHAGSGIDTEETLAAVKRVLDKLQKQSRGLQR
jgi:ParB family chromosome partitioning protein